MQFSPLFGDLNSLFHAPSAYPTASTSSAAPAYRRKPVQASDIEDDAFGGWPFSGFGSGPFGRSSFYAPEPRRTLPAPSVRVVSQPGQALILADLPHCPRRSVSVSVRPSRRAGAATELLLQAVQENPDARRFELAAGLRRVAPDAALFEKTFAIPWRVAASDLKVRWEGAATLVIAVPEPRPKAQPAVNISANVNPLISLLTGTPAPAPAPAPAAQLPDVEQLRSEVAQCRDAAASRQSKLEAALARRKEAEEQLEIARRLAREAAEEVAQVSAEAETADAALTRASRGLAAAEEAHRRREAEAKARAAAQEREEQIQRRLADAAAARRAQAEAAASSSASSASSTSVDEEDVMGDFFDLFFGAPRRSAPVTRGRRPAPAAKPQQRKQQAAAKRPAPASAPASPESAPVPILITPAPAAGPLPAPALDAQSTARSVSSSASSSASWMYKDEDVEIRDPTAEEDRELSSYRDGVSPTLATADSPVQVVKIPE